MDFTILSTMLSAATCSFWIMAVSTWASFVLLTSLTYRTVRSTTPRSSLFKARYHMPCLKADRLASNSFFTDKALPLAALLFSFGELFWASEVLQALA